MKRYVSLFIGCIVLAGILFSSCSSSKRHDRYVVVLSMDGFRSDYPDRAYTPTLDSLAKVGIRAAFRPSFPSVTFPNHYSMATGLHPDHHGLVNNFFYASDLDSIYRMADPTPGFYGGEPIWNTAEKQGVHAPLSSGWAVSIRSRAASLPSGNLLIKRSLIRTAPIL